MVSEFLLIPLWLLIGVAVYFSLVLSADLHIGQFSANTPNSRLLEKTTNKQLYQIVICWGKVRKTFFSLVQGLTLHQHLLI